MTGRALAMVPELGADLQPAGWRLTGGAPGIDQRRARSLLAQDLDMLEEHTQGYDGRLKVQVAGPWTLAATVERPKGDRLLADHGARRELAQALAEGLRVHIADVRRRVPGATLVVQVDEPALPAVLAGGIASTSGARRFAPVAAGTAEQTLRSVVTSAGVPVLVHCCAERPPVGLLRAAGAAGLSLDLTVLPRDLDDELGAAVEAGLVLLAGVVPAVAPADGLSVPADTVEPVRRLWHRLGLTPAALRQVVVTPTCGMPGASPGHALSALRLARAAAQQLADDTDD
jgi:hypothetical protein